MAEARHSALTTLVHRCRRYFTPGAAAEIWAHFSPALADPQRPEGFEVRGVLCIVWVVLAVVRGGGGGGGGLAARG